MAENDVELENELDEIQAAAIMEDMENANPVVQNMAFNAVVSPLEALRNEALDNGISKKGEVARLVEVSEGQGFVSMHIPGSGIRAFHFTKVHSSEANQEKIYENSIRESVSSVLNGCNACILCYGQTGSGKTYTYLGPEGCLETDELQDMANYKTTTTPSIGLVPRVLEELFSAKTIVQRNGIELSIGLQMIEIYEEKGTDLLTGNPAVIRKENGQALASTKICETFEIIW
jgi:hypothetical protein